MSMTGGALNPKRFPLLFDWLLLCPTPSGLFGRLMPRPPSWFLLSRPYEAPFIGDASKREFCLSSSSGYACSGCWFIKLLLDGCYLSESMGSFGGCWCFLDVTDCLRCWLLLPCPTPRSPKGWGSTFFSSLSFFFSLCFTTFLNLEPALRTFDPSWPPSRLEAPGWEPLSLP